jgi:ATP-dependent Clp protease ATP-binding subunit ClpB
MSSSQENSQSYLLRYCLSFTDLAKQGKLDPVIGRNDEIRRVIQILSRKTKNNPLLIGEPGVGKTAIIEGIALRIVADDVPSSLHNISLYSLDIGLLMAGASYQGEFEKRLKGLLAEIKEKSDSIIMFIDEIHMIVGAGSTGGGMDFSNLIKPALARGELHCIGATTLKEWKKYIEKDAALERRFQKVLVEEPSQEDALSMLRGLKGRYELHHGVKIRDQALVSAVSLSIKYIHDRFLPDKAIDLVDEAASMIKMTVDSSPSELDSLTRRKRQLEIEKIALEKEKDEASKARLKLLEEEKADVEKKYDTLFSLWEEEKRPLGEIAELKKKIEEAETMYAIASREGDYEKASRIKYGELSRFESRLEEIEKERQNKKNKIVKDTVDAEDIALVIAKWTGIPAQELSESETEKLARLEDSLNQEVIGQEEAISEVVGAITVDRMGLRSRHRPIGSFFFLGPTGVGKTEVAKRIAKSLFGRETDMIRIDMSEYMEKHSVSRLIGAPPGYVGYEEGGQLTEALRHKLYAVILFDEFEKAHPDVWNIFLQILDEGQVTDGQGRKISTRETIIIMTSNMGAEYIADTTLAKEEVERKILELLKQRVKREILNRFDAIVIFNRLSEKVVRRIIENKITKLVDFLKTKNISLEYDSSLIGYITEKAYSREFGARPLDRFIEKNIVRKISQLILEKKSLTSQKKCSITISVSGDDLYFNIKM